MTTATIPEGREKQAAKLLDRFNEMFDGDDSLLAMPDRIKKIEAHVDGMKGIDLKKTQEEFDRLKADTQRLHDAIRHSKRGAWFPGIEDVGKKFSLTRAVAGITSGKWEDENGRLGEKSYEREVLTEARLKMSQQIGTDTLGGYWVPDQIIPDVIEAIYTRSAFIALNRDDGETAISVLDGLSGMNVKIPKFDGGMIAYWIGEQDNYVESAVNTGDVTMNAKKLGVLWRLTDEVRRFTGPGFENRARRDMAKAAAKKLDWTIAFGTGTENMPRGITKHQGIKWYRAETGASYGPGTPNTYADLQAVTTWAGGALTFDGIMNMQLTLEEDDVMLDETAKLISAPRYFTKLKQSKVDNYSGQSTNQPYLLMQPMINDSQLASLVGPFGKSNQISSATAAAAVINGTTTGDGANPKHTVVFYGNLGEVVLGRWGGIEIADDNGRGLGFKTDHIYVKMRMYADVAIRQERAIIVCPDAKVR